MIKEPITGASIILTNNLNTNPVKCGAANNPQTLRKTNPNSYLYEIWVCKRPLISSGSYLAVDKSTSSAGTMTHLFAIQEKKKKGSEMGIQTASFYFAEALDDQNWHHKPCTERERERGFSERRIGWDEVSELGWSYCHIMALLCRYFGFEIQSGISFSKAKRIFFWEMLKKKKKTCKTTGLCNIVLNIQKVLRNSLNV